MSPPSTLHEQAIWLVDNYEKLATTYLFSLKLDPEMDDRCMYLHEHSEEFAEFVAEIYTDLFPS